MSLLNVTSLSPETCVATAAGTATVIIVVATTNTCPIGSICWRQLPINSIDGLPGISAILLCRYAQVLKNSF